MMESIKQKPTKSIKSTKRRWIIQSRYAPRGLALILVMMAVAMASTLSVGFLASQGTAAGISVNINRLARARAIAESGLDITAEHMQANTNWRTDYTHGAAWVSAQSFASGTFTVYGEDGEDLDGDGTIGTSGTEGDGDLTDDSSDVVTLTSVGTYEGVTHSVIAVVLPGSTTTSAWSLLMVVGNGSNPESDDLKKTTLFESWGYIVTYIDDSASSSAFNTALAAASVVYLSETVSSSSVGTKLTLTTVGVVSEEGYCNDALEITSANSGSVSDTAIDIVDNSHYITSTFSTGSLTVLSSAHHFRTHGGTLASGAAVLGERMSSSDRVLVVVDIGGTLEDNSSALGRRVLLPFADDNFDYDNLMTDGKTLIQRALAWAAGAESLPTIYAHWKLNETSGSGAASDISANGFNATLSSMAVASDWVTGKFGNALDFDGSDDRAVATGTFVPPTDGSLSFWMKYNAAPSSEEQLLGVNTAWEVRLDTAGKLHFDLQKSGTNNTFMTASAISTGQWVHVVANYKVSDDTYEVYVDSVLVKSGSYNLTAASSGTITLGVRTGSSSYFTGQLDDVRVYSRSLTLSEVASIYAGSSSDTSGSNAPTLIALYELVTESVTPVLVGHWKLDGAGSNGGMVVADEDIEMSDSTKIDSYDSSSGVYGGSNILSNATVMTNATSSKDWEMEDSASVKGDAYVGTGGNPSSVIKMKDSSSITGSKSAQTSNFPLPSVSAPSGMPSSEGNKTYNSGTYTINSNRHFNELKIKNGATIGNITIQVDKKCEINSAEIVIPSGSSLLLYCKKEVKLKGSAKINNDSSAVDRFTLELSHGDKELKMESSSIICGMITTTDDIEMKDSATIYGGVYCGDDLEMSDSSAIHIDESMSNYPSFAGGSSATDEVIANNGTGNGGVTTGASGFGDGGTAFNFDGSNDFVEIDHDASYLIDEGVISFWFNADNAGGTQGLFAKDSSGYDNGGHIRVYLDNTAVKVRLQSTTASYSLTSGNAAFTPGTWTHVVVTFGANGLKLYVDGVLKDTDSYTGGLGTSSGGSGNNEPITLGVDQASSGNQSTSGWNNPFDGDIDEVRLYSTQLDATQVTNLAAKTEPGNAYSSILKDTSGYGLALDLTLADPANVTWDSASGLTFDTATIALDDGVNTKLYDVLSLTGQYTIEVKFQTDSTSSASKAITSLANASNVNFRVVTESSVVEWHNRTSASTSAGQELDSTALLNTTSTFHAVASYDGSDMNLYIDNALNSTASHAGDFSTWSSAYRFAIGNVYNGSNGFLGKITRVAIYDKAVTSTQASEIFGGSVPTAASSGSSGGFSVRWEESP